MAMRYAMKMADTAKEALDKAYKALVGSYDDKEDEDDDTEKMFSAEKMDEHKNVHHESLAKAAVCMAKAMKAIGPFLPNDGGAPMQFGSWPAASARIRSPKPAPRR